MNDKTEHPPMYIELGLNPETAEWFRAEEMGSGRLFTATVTKNENTGVISVRFSESAARDIVAAKDAEIGRLREAMTETELACRDYMEYLESPDPNSDRLSKYENPIFEAAMEMVFGKDVWKTRINPRLHEIES